MEVKNRIESTICNELKTPSVILLRPVIGCFVELIEIEMKR
jgi:hypothetical protein